MKLLDKILVAAVTVTAVSIAIGQVAGPVVWGSFDGNILKQHIPFSAGAGTSAVIATQQYIGAALPLTGTTANIGGALLLAGACTSGTVSVAGATTGMSVSVSPVTYPGDGGLWHGYVSASGVVTVKVCAVVAVTPIATAYNVRVIQ